MKRLFVLLGSALVLILGMACSKMSVLKIDLEKGVLSTPDKDVRLHLRSGKNFKLNKKIRATNRWRGLYLHAHDAKYEVVLFLAPSNSFRSFVQIAFPGEYGTEKIVSNIEGSYSYNSAEAKPLTLTDSFSNEVESPGIASRKYYLALPQELLAHQITEHGDGLVSVERYQDRLEKEHYRFIITMLINNEPYAMDATLRFEIGTKMGGGVPGMP